MMKISILLVTILTIISCKQNDVLPTNENYRLIRILIYPNTTSLEPYGLVELEYDKQGDLIKESMFDYPNTLTTYKAYEYVNNRIVRKKIYDGQVGNITLGTYVNYYYTNEHITKQELFLSDGSLKYTTYFEYDEDRLINSFKVDDKLGIHHQYQYTFDNLDRLTLERTFMYDQELSGFIKHYYDDSNRIIKSEFYDHNESITFYTEKTYSGLSSLPNKELSFDPNAILTQERHFNYDGWDNLTETIIVSQGGSCSLFKRKYDGELLIGEIKFNPNFGCTELAVSKYEYEKY